MYVFIVIFKRIKFSFNYIIFFCGQKTGTRIYHHHNNSKRSLNLHFNVFVYECFFFGGKVKNEYACRKFFVYPARCVYRSYCKACVFWFGFCGSCAADLKNRKENLFSFTMKFGKRKLLKIIPKKKKIIS